MLGPLFSAIDVAPERPNSMLAAAKVRVCSVVNTDVAAVRLPRYCLAAAPEEKLLACNAAFSYLPEVDALRDFNRQKIT
jgi:hypothetical protein